VWPHSRLPRDVLTASVAARRISVVFTPDAIVLPAAVTRIVTVQPKSTALQSFVQRTLGVRALGYPVAVLTFDTRL
jgi:hypothetical protein